MSSIKKDSIRHQFNEELQEMRRQLSEKDRIFEDYKKERGGLEVFFRKVENSVPAITPMPIQWTSKVEKQEGEVFAVMQTSDSHMGAVQQADEIEGLNTYNPEICTARNMGFAESALSYFNVLRKSYNIRNLHWVFTGDLISGDIHDELRITNAFPAPKQVAEAANVHANQIASLAPFFDEIVIEFISADNHARLTKKPQAQEAGMNSLNYLVGILMKQYLSKHDNVDFRLHPVAEKVIRIGNMQYLATHGNNIRGWMGVPWYGIERQVGKESTARLAHIMREQTDKMIELSRKIGFHKLLHGHFHVNFDHPLFCAAASIQGTTTLDHSNGRYCEPGQPAWLVHSKHGEFARTNFKLKQFV